MNCKPVPLLFAALWVGGCYSPEAKSINSDSAPSAIPAIKSAAEADDQAAIPRLVHDLSDNDSAIRFAAITALRKMTGKDFGYRYYETFDQRRVATNQWNQWLMEHPIATAMNNRSN
jgi:hypothetical protein